jgi:hypothetical protein
VSRCLNTVICSSSTLRIEEHSVKMLQSQKRHSFGLDLAKISIYGDKTETRCPPKNRGVFHLLKKVDFQKILTFCNSREGGFLCELEGLVELILNLSSLFRFFIPCLRSSSTMEVWTLRFLDLVIYD